VLMTSRLTTWGAGVDPVLLGKLDEDASVEFLLERTQGQRASLPDDEIHARNLARELDGLPLALEQAAAFISHRTLSLPDYLDRWQKHDTRTREWHNEREMKYPRPLATTWETTLELLDPAARTILNLFAWLSPVPLPPCLRDPAQLAAALSDETDHSPTTAEIEDALAQLVDYSMIQRDEAGETSGPSLSVHRLVQDITRFHIPEESEREWVTRALQFVSAVTPTDSDDVRTWPDWDPLRAGAFPTLRLA